MCLYFQVRFHPASSEVLASGSLDNEVRLWNANTAECVGSRDFCELLCVFPIILSVLSAFCPSYVDGISDNIVNAVLAVQYVVSGSGYFDY